MVVGACEARRTARHAGRPCRHVPKELGDGDGGLLGEGLSIHGPWREEWGYYGHYDHGRHGATVLLLVFHGGGSCERKTPSRTGSQGGKEPALDGVLLATRRGRRGSKNNGRHRDAFLHMISYLARKRASTPLRSGSLRPRSAGRPSNKNSIFQRKIRLKFLQVPHQSHEFPLLPSDSSVRPVLRPE